MNDDRLRYWARFLLGAAILLFQLQHGVQIWLLLIAAWLLGGPLEALIALFTSGRIQINVKNDDPPQAPPPPPPPPLPPSPDAEPTESGSDSTTPKPPPVAS